MKAHFFSLIMMIVITLVIAFVLMVLPLPHWAINFRPMWVLMIVIYWTIVLPHGINIGIAWLNGLFLDSLQGTLLGENALCFAVLTYIVFKLHRRFLLFSRVLQMICILILALINQLLIFWLQGIQGQTLSVTWFFGPAITSAILWPWIFWVLENFTKHYQLNRA